MKRVRAFFSSSVGEFIFLLSIVILIRTIGFGLYQVPTGSMETTLLAGERFFADKFTILFSAPKQGQIIAFNNPLYHYSTNPIIRFIEEYFWGPDNWTKRVIGVPGDTIKGTIEDGHPVVYRNGQKLDEPYVNKYPLLAIYEDSSQTRRIPISFDPEKPLNQQPFYRIMPGNIIHASPNVMSLLLPGTPLSPRPDRVHREGNNYWNNGDEFYIELGPSQYWVMGDNRLGSDDSRFWGPLDGKHIHGKILFRIWSVDSRAWLWLFDLISHPIDFWSRVRWNRFLQIVR